MNRTTKEDGGHFSALDDKISKMPWPILDNILGRLRVNDAMKTSILSREWRNKWVHVSKLLFDETCIRRDVYETKSLVDFVYFVLLSHRGHINTFKFSTYYRPDFCEFDHWIEFLSRNCIKELTLEFGEDDYKQSEKYRTPPCLFSCQQLTHLNLGKALLAPPDNFQGFKNLVSLDLPNYANDTQVLAGLICKCPVLERLVLKYFRNLVPFNIEAPKLKYLCLEGTLGTIVLENCPVLVDVTFRMTSDSFSVVKYREHKMTHDLIHYLGCLSTLTRLKLSGFLLKHLVHNWDVSETSFAAGNHLKVLELDEIHMNVLSETKAALTILKLFSNLQELHLSCWIGETCPQSFQFPDQSSCCFDLLQVVSIHIFTTYGLTPTSQNSRHQVNFIKFLLDCSPALERMIIMIDKRIPYETFHKEIMRELMSCKASEDVQITFSSIFS